MKRTLTLLILLTIPAFSFATVLTKSTAKTFVGDGSLLTGISTHTFKIGDSYSGGKVFWVDSTGTQVLIATGMNVFAAWGGGGLLNASLDGVYAGKTNTFTINTEYPTTTTGASTCRDLSYLGGNNGYFNDWYLPSKAELLLLYAQRALFPGYANNYYQSSTEYDASDAWVVNFADGTETHVPKFNGVYIKCIRAGPATSISNFPTNAQTVTNGAYITSTQTFSGANTFTSSVTIGGNLYPTTVCPANYRLVGDGLGVLTCQPPAASAGLTFMIGGASPDIAGYLQMVDVSSFTPAARSTSTVASVTLNQYISSAATNVGYPNTTYIPAGTWLDHLHAVAGAGNRIKLTMEVYTRTATGVETDLCASEQSSFIPNTETELDMYAVCASTAIEATTRIIRKLKATTVTGAATSISIYGSGFGTNATNARLELPSTAFSANTYLPKTGGTMTGALAVTGASSYITGQSSITTTGNFYGHGATLTGIIQSTATGSYPLSISGNAATVTTNANLTGNVTSVGNTTTLVSVPASAVDLSTVTSALGGKQATGNYITALTGNVTASGPGSVVATIVSIPQAAVNLSTVTTRIAALESKTSTAAYLGDTQTFTGTNYFAAVTASSMTLLSTGANDLQIHAALNSIATLSLYNDTLLGLSIHSHNGAGAGYKGVDFAGEKAETLRFMGNGSYSFATTDSGDAAHTMMVLGTTSVDLNNPDPGLNSGIGLRVGSGAIFSSSVTASSFSGAGTGLTDTGASFTAGKVSAGGVDFSTITARIAAEEAKTSTAAYLASTQTFTGAMTITGNTSTYGLQVSSNVSLAGAIYTKNGNVGIGTEASTNLHVLGVSKPPSSAIGDGIFTVAGNSTLRLLFGSANSSPYGMWMQVTDDSNSGSARPLLLNPVRGNVGIGTTNPTATLELTGTAKILGAWVNKSASYANQQAESDSLIYAVGVPSTSGMLSYKPDGGNPTTPGTLSCKTDASNPATTIRSQASGLTAGYSYSVFCAVRKGDYWLIYKDGVMTVTSVYLIPFGN